MERYSVIKEKNPREIVLLRGRGCVYKKCTFCDYHTDRCNDDEENYQLNHLVLSSVTGQYGNLEVINSGSVFELDGKTLGEIKHLCKEKGITTIHFESHYLYNDKIPALRQIFEGFDLKMKLGLETFDYDFRENVLNKGIKERAPDIIADNFDEANFLFGINGQSEQSMLKDIELGLEHFERICINIMCNNSTGIKPDRDVIKVFMDRLYPVYRNNDRMDILINNTDFGVGD
ncbi:MAG: radical SAM protein [Eubacterium sp.]|nr:radical SAM protein [Eubacterium sp.]MDE5973175.1 radical SAM protein [Eubacterium sp.]